MRYLFLNRCCPFCNHSDIYGDIRVFTKNTMEKPWFSMVIFLFSLRIPWKTMVFHGDIPSFY